MESKIEKILIDTNIIIHLEDNKIIDANYSDLNRICSAYGIRIYIHESSYKDLSQDKDTSRRSISLSKLEKYPRINKTPRTISEKENYFGEIKNSNDDVDTDLLVSLDLNTVDLLVSEDKNLKSRVKHHRLKGSVLSLLESLALLRKNYGEIIVDYQYVQDKTCNQYHHDNNFFASLKADYKGEFKGWYEKCMSQQRPCWVIEQKPGVAGGMIIYKDEQGVVGKDKVALDLLGVPGNKILKLCLFKIDENIRGEKFGEQLLKKALDYAFRNKYDALYLTVFPKHITLIRLLSKFGFQKGNNKENEEVYYKFSKVTLLEKNISPFNFHQTFWPCVQTSGVDKYCIPILPEYLDRLFPEAFKILNETPRSPFQQLLLLPQSNAPGNAIQKVYVCNSNKRIMKPGDILLFYCSKLGAITTVGVLENYSKADDFAKLIELVGNRSVYSNEELLAKMKQKQPVKVINFYFAENFSNPLYLEDLVRMGILKGAPQSISQLPETSFNLLLSVIDVKARDIFYE